MSKFILALSVTVQIFILIKVYNVTVVLSKMCLKMMILIMNYFGLVKNDGKNLICKRTSSSSSSYEELIIIIIILLPPPPIIIIIIIIG